MRKINLSHIIFPLIKTHLPTAKAATEKKEAAAKATAAKKEEATKAAAEKKAAQEAKKAEG